MKKIKLVKLEEAPNPNYPNNIPVGYEKEGEFVDYPKIGAEFYLNRLGFPFWRTSLVQEIISFDTFRTQNSIYKIIPVEE